jgi:multidrug efflux pump subunit AcrA (membrane-fusion protein)
MAIVRKNKMIPQLLLGAATVVGIAGFAVSQVAPPATPAPAPRSATSATPGEERGFTEPSDQSDISFPVPGIVSKVSVKPGDVVKVGQAIAQQDDREEVARAKITEAELVSAKLQILASQADLDKKRVDVRRVETLYRELIAQGKTNTEIDEARVNVIIGEIAVKYRNGEVAQKALELELAKVKVEQRKIVSPIDGVVARVDLHAGEGTDLNRPAGILLVKNNPIRVKVNVPSAKAQTLKVGQDLQVKYVDGGEWMTAKITDLAAVGLAGAGVRTVRLEMPNPAVRETGLQVVVRLPENLAAAGRATR